MLKKYIIFHGLAFLSSTYAVTTSSGIMAETLIKERSMTLVYLGRDIPGQIIGLGLSILLNFKMKNHYRIGLLSSSLLPIATAIEVFSVNLDSKSLPYAVLLGGTLRTISFIAPTGAHNASIVKAIKCYKEAGDFGIRNMVVTSSLSTLGATSAILGMSYIENEQYKKYTAIAVSMLYPLFLRSSWKLMGINR